MSTDREWKQLCDIYAQKYDDELLDLFSRRDDLTEMAQQALAEEMRKRKLSTVPLEAGSGPGALVKEDLPGSTEEESVAAYEAVVWWSTSGTEMSRAAAILNESGIDNRIVLEKATATSDQGSREIAEFGLVVHQKELDLAQAALREGAGLFPVSEGPVDEMTVAFGPMNFLQGFNPEEEMEEALELAAVLARAGVSFLWTDGRDMPGGFPEAKSISIDVRAETLERAQIALEQHLELRGPVAKS